MTMTIFVLEVAFLYTLAIVVFVLMITNNMKNKAISNAKSWFRIKQNAIYDIIGDITEDIETINNTMVSEPYRSIVHIDIENSRIASIIIPKLYDINDNAKEIAELKNTASSYYADNSDQIKSYDDTISYIVGNNYILYRKYNNDSGSQKDIILSKAQTLSEVFKTLQIMSGEDVYYNSEGGDLND